MIEKMQTKQVKQKNQIALILLFLIGFLPLGIAYWMYYSGHLIPEKTTNQGQLIQPPASIGQLQLNQLNSEPFAQEQFSKKWWFIYINQENFCDSECDKKLYMLRQVNHALGKDAERVRRILLTHCPFAQESVRLLQKNYPDLLIACVRREHIEQLGQKIKVTPLHQHVLIMDPLQNIMLDYSPTDAGKDFLKDLKKLLRISRIG